MLSPSDLPDIRDTQTGRDLIAIGKREGLRERKRSSEDRGWTLAILVIVKDRFRSVPKELEERLSKMSRRSKRNLLRAMFRFESVAEFKAWLKRYPLK